MNNMMKKGLLTCAISLGAAQGLMASKIDLTTHGRLSAGFFGYSAPKNGSSSFNNLGLNAYVKADFGLNENWNVGMGAAGIWNMLSIFPIDNNLLPYTSNGDVADIYMVYKKNGLKVVAGRYNIDTGSTIVRSSAFVNGHLQGVSVQWNPSGNTSAYKVWAHYINSFLDNGYLPGRIGSDLAMLNPYFDSGKAKIGGEVFLFGADYSKKGIFLSPYLLINTKAPNGTTKMGFNPVFQIGASAKYTYKFNPNWHSITSANLMFQYGDMANNNAAADNFLGFIYADEEVKYVRYGTNKAGKQYEIYSISFGGGARAVLANEQGRVFSLNDRTRFYGKFLNGAGIGQGGTWTLYLFGKMNHRLFEAQVLAGGGTYTEISAVGLWKAYRQNRNSDEGSFLGFDVGGGYVFAHGAGAANHGLMAFAKLSY